MRGKRILIGRNGISVRFANTLDKEQLADLRVLQQHDDWGTDYSDYDSQFYNRTLNGLEDFLSWKNDTVPSKGVILVAEKEGKIITTV